MFRKKKSSYEKYFFLRKNISSYEKCFFLRKNISSYEKYFFLRNCISSYENYFFLRINISSYQNYFFLRNSFSSCKHENFYIIGKRLSLSKNILCVKNSTTHRSWQRQSVPSQHSSRQKRGSQACKQRQHQQQQ